MKFLMVFFLITFIALFTLLLPSTTYASICGSVIKTAGTVELIRNNQTLPVKPGMSIYPEDIIKTGAAGECLLVFLDGSKISVSENTRFRIATASFKMNVRKIGLKLDQGQIRSLVEKFYNNGSEFYVQTSQAVAGVRGTDFLTRTSGQDGITDVSVISGRVSVRDLINNRDTLINAGQRLEINSNQGTPEIQSFSPNTVAPMNSRLETSKPLVIGNLQAGSLPATMGRGNSDHLNNPDHSNVATGPGNSGHQNNSSDNDATSPPGNSDHQDNPGDDDDRTPERDNSDRENNPGNDDDRTPERDNSDRENNPGDDDDRTPGNSDNQNKQHNK